MPCGKLDQIRSKLKTCALLHLSKSPLEVGNLDYFTGPLHNSACLTLIQDLGNRPSSIIKELPIPSQCRETTIFSRTIINPCFFHLPLPLTPLKPTQVTRCKCLTPSVAQQATWWALSNFTALSCCVHGNFPGYCLYYACGLLYMWLWWWRLYSTAQM